MIPGVWISCTSIAEIILSYKLYIQCIQSQCVLAIKMQHKVLRIMDYRI